ncbi:hypothetical protein L596_008686 [Steinernema carpocapsae]|uniref:Uncharacterized protein n=1 Tax=Steinernema carpocapsae TaxID=34508 RepID=A0A4U5PE22_STECR|nr:hypothetical protein L596_008686 [Steinernema carpocapsae]
MVSVVGVRQQGRSLGNFASESDPRDRRRNGHRQGQVAGGPERRSAPEHAPLRHAPEHHEGEEAAGVEDTIGPRNRCVSAGGIRAFCSQNRRTCGKHSHACLKA